MEIFRPKNNRVHVSRRCGNFPDSLIEWINNFKKADFYPVYEPGHVKCRYIGTPGSRDDDFGGKFHFSGVPPGAVQVSSVSRQI